jgi:hypothetical protein
MMFSLTPNFSWVPWVGYTRNRFTVYQVTQKTVETVIDSAANSDTSMNRGVNESRIVPAVVDSIVPLRPGVHPSVVLIQQAS